MARIAGVDLPRDKRVEIGLTYIYGIGRTSASRILADAGVDPPFSLFILSLIEAADALLIIMPHPTGLLPISQPRRVLLAPFPGTDLIRQCKRRVLEAIYNRIRSSHMPALPMIVTNGRNGQTTEAGHTHCRYLMGRYGVTLLYIKQLYTHPRVSCCQPPKSLHKLPVN